MSAFNEAKRELARLDAKLETALNAPFKKPSSPLDKYWVDGQMTGQMDAFSGATQNPYVQIKRLHRDGSLQAQCDEMIDGGYRGSTLSFNDDQREVVMRFARREANGEVRYRGVLCVFRDAD